jgi:hypothetical protein
MIFTLLFSFKNLQANFPLLPPHLLNEPRSIKRLQK